MRILYPWSSFSHLNTQISDMTDNFITLMEESLGVKRNFFDFEKLWQDSNPICTGRPLMQYMQKVRVDTIEIVRRLAENEQ